MATHSSILAWKIPDRGAWRATVQGATEDSNMTEHVLGLGNKNCPTFKKKVETEAILSHYTLCSFFFSPPNTFFFFFQLCWVFTAVDRLSLVTASRGYSSLLCTGFSLQWLLTLWSIGLRCMCFNSCSTGAQ